MLRRGRVYTGSVNVELVSNEQCATEQIRFDAETIT
jgi:hypothetical protein